MLSHFFWGRSYIFFFCYDLVASTPIKAERENMSNYVWKVKKKCQSDPSKLEGSTTVNRENENRVAKKKLNVSKFVHSPSVPSAQTNQEAVVVVLDTSSVGKNKGIFIDSEIKPLSLTQTCANQDLKITPNLDNSTDPQLSRSLDSSLPSSSSGKHPASLKCPPNSNKPKTRKAKNKHIKVEKGDSPLYAAVQEDLNKRDIVPGPFPKSDPSLPSSSFGTTPASTNSKTPKARNKHIRAVKGGLLPLYVIPKDIKKLIKRDIVPQVLKDPLSPSTYRDYFAALLYAEDYYFEKWDGFEMENVSMELKRKKADIYGKKGKYKNLSRIDEKDAKIFVQFEIESIPHKRPFLLSRDFAYVRPSGSQDEPFQGIIHRVVKSKHLLVEFGKDFLKQHYSTCKYDVKFSFNRICLKRAHQAIEAASDVLFSNFLFPDFVPETIPDSSEDLVLIHPELDGEQARAVHRIVIHQIPPPYLFEGPLSVTRNEQLTTTGKVVQAAVLQLCRISSLSRILICAPKNITCDVLMRSLQKGIPESDIFRSNAAFRELIEVPDDILPFCPYEEEEEFFPCPPLQELEKFRVILSTFMTTSRLNNEGLRAGHFSHIFLVDASSAIEPEILVPLANLANEKTVVVVTGAPRNSSGWVRSNIARQNGLKRSYFVRLRESQLYTSLDSKVISKLAS